MKSSYVLYLHNNLGSIRMKINSSTMFAEQIISIHILHFTWCTKDDIFLSLRLIFYPYHSFSFLIPANQQWHFPSTSFIICRFHFLHNTYKLTTTFTIYCVYYCHRIRHLLLLQRRRPTIASQMMLIHTLNIIDCTKTQYSLMHIPYGFLSHTIPRVPPGLTDR